VDGSAQLHLLEITRSVRGDPLGNALMDEVLTACFDHSHGYRGALERLVAALNRFNGYLSGPAQHLSMQCFRGTPAEISLWAEQLTSQILSNRQSSGERPASG
jgi:hypothetical protein